MSSGQKLLIGLGIVLLGTMMLIGAFSLGVYVGAHGWTREGLRLQGPAPPPQPPAGQGMPALPRDRNVLYGRIRHLSGESITLDTPEGPRTVSVSNETRVRWKDDEEREGTLQDLRFGMTVAVWGRFDPDIRMLRAEIVLIFPTSKR